MYTTGKKSMQQKTDKMRLECKFRLIEKSNSVQLMVRRNQWGRGPIQTNTCAYKYKHTLMHRNAGELLLLIKPFRKIQYFQWKGKRNLPRATIPALTRRITMGNMVRRFKLIENQSKGRPYRDQKIKKGNADKNVSLIWEFGTGESEIVTTDRIQQLIQLPFGTKTKTPTGCCNRCRMSEKPTRLYFWTYHRHRFLNEIYSRKRPLTIQSIFHDHGSN